MNEANEPVELLRTGDAFEADVVEGLLGSAGIPYVRRDLLANGASIPTVFLAPFQPSQHVLIVPRSAYEAALECMRTRPRPSR